MSDMKCPFCQQGLYYCGEDIYCCPNHEEYMGSENLWQELIRTQKALDVANEKLRHCVNITVEELDELKGNLLIAWNALLHFSKDPIANNALKKITALEQKESAFVHNKIEFPEYNDNLLEEFDKQFFENGQDDDLTETALEQKE